MSEYIPILERLKDDLESAIQQCGKGILLVEEAKTLVENTKKVIRELIPPTTSAFRIFNRSSRELPQWWPVTQTKYLDANHCELIQQWVLVINKMIEELEPAFLRKDTGEKNEYFLPEGDPYRAKSIVFNLMKRASENLDILDPYLDDEVFKYIESLNPSVNVKLLTGKFHKMFRELYDSLKGKTGNLEAVSNDSFHDRYLVIDNTEVWNLGCSINGLGKKASTVNRLIDRAEREDFFSNFKSWWENGKIL